VIFCAAEQTCKSIESPASIGAIAAMSARI